jgi:hypothetical protein
MFSGTYLNVDQAIVGVLYLQRLMQWNQYAVTNALIIPGLETWDDGQHPALGDAVAEHSNHGADAKGVAVHGNAALLVYSRLRPCQWVHRILG